MRDFSKLPLSWYLDRYDPQEKIQHSRHEHTQWNVRIAIGSFVRTVAPESAKLLEIGGFTGWHTLYYRDQILRPQRAVIYDWQDFRTASVREEADFKQVDMETQDLPDSNQSFDIIVCNQVFEHLKNIYSPITEIHRLLKPGGHLIISVPNMTALHNRILFVLGRQPTTTRIMGSHVRGYAMRDFDQFLTLNGHFEVKGKVGLGIHPFTSEPAPKPLSSLCHTPVWLLQKSQSTAPLWREIMETKGSSSNFFPDQQSPLEVWNKTT